MKIFSSSEIIPLEMRSLPAPPCSCRCFLLSELCREPHHLQSVVPALQDGFPQCDLSLLQALGPYPSHQQDSCPAEHLCGWGPQSHGLCWRHKSPWHPQDICQQFSDLHWPVTFHVVIQVREKLKKITLRNKKRKDPPKRLISAGRPHRHVLLNEWMRRL